MKYYGVIVDLLTRSTTCIEGDYPEKHDKEYASAFCYCKWFKSFDSSEQGMLFAEYMQLKYEALILEMFQKLDISSPSPFAKYARTVKATGE